MLRLDVHLQAVPAGRAVATLFADKQLLAAVLEGLVQVQLRAREEAFGAGGALEEEETGPDEKRWVRNEFACVCVCKCGNPASACSPRVA